MLKSKKELAIATVIFLQIFLQLASSQVITLGVAPSEFMVQGVGSTCFDIQFFNSHGDIDANYTLVPDSCMNNYIVSYPHSTIVPKGTNLNVNTIKGQICVSGNFNKKQECFIYVKGTPYGENITQSTLQIERQVAVRFRLGEGNSLSPTTSTTTSTTTRPATTLHTTTTHATTVSMSSGTSGSSSSTISTSSTTIIPNYNPLNIETTKIGRAHV